MKQARARPVSQPPTPAPARSVMRDSALQNPRLSSGNFWHSTNGTAAKRATSGREALAGGGLGGRRIDRHALDGIGGEPARLRPVVIAELHRRPRLRQDRDQE